MKAAVYTRYGPPDVVVQIKETERPVPKDSEVLIEVRAASLNPVDGHLMRAPFLLRLMTGLRIGSPGATGRGGGRPVAFAELETTG
jgi:hypothetical protein